MTTQELWERLMDLQTKRKPFEAYAELAFGTWFRQHVCTDRVWTERTYDVPAGTPVCVLMASRLGDVAITEDLTARTGYRRRTNPSEGLLTNCRIVERGEG